MENNICKFYENKFKIFCLILIGILLLFGCYLFIENTSSEERFVGYIGLIFFGICTVTAISKICSDKPFIEITPVYIQMYNFEKLWWTDITSIQNVQIRGTKFFYFDVKDVSKYKLTFWQKVNCRMGFPPFYISLATLSKKDLEKLQRLIKQYAPENIIQQ